MADICEVVNLNIGGVVHTTSLATIQKFPDSMIGRMFSGKFNIPVDRNGYIFIDRDGDLFRYILNYMRCGQLNLPLEFKELDQLVFEADFYQINPLLQELHEMKRDADERRRLKEEEEVLSKEHYASLEVTERINMDRRVFHRMIYEGGEFETTGYDMDNQNIHYPNQEDEDWMHHQHSLLPHEREHIHGMRRYVEVRGKKGIIAKYIGKIEDMENKTRNDQELIMEFIEPEKWQYEVNVNCDRMYIREKLLGCGWVLQNSVTTTVKENDRNNLPERCSQYHSIVRDSYTLNQWHHKRNLLNNGEMD